MASMENQAVKRKRSPVEIVQPSPRLIPQSGPGAVNVTQINYLAKTEGDKMQLIKGDSETFADVLDLIDDYEGVLQRHESLAANLGAKLVGPLLLKSLDKLFEAPIKVVNPYAEDGVVITWLDVLEFAKNNPQDFLLSDSGTGSRVCRFWVKDCSVEISEDDYRLILSGAPQRMIPVQPIPEDEAAELGTMDILEQRLAMLIKKADLVAGRARQLNYHLKGRKAAIQNRRASISAAETPGSTTATLQGSEMRSPTVFQAVNYSSTSTNGETSPAQNSLHQDLLRQFLTPSSHRKSMDISSGVSRTNKPLPHTPNSGSPAHDHYRRPTNSGANKEDWGGLHRPLMLVRVEKLNRGDVITPSCDRCRRLEIECTKHLTACTGCTKKHARCSWRDMTDAEAQALMQGGGDAPVASASPPSNTVADGEAAPVSENVEDSAADVTALTPSTVQQVMPAH